MPLDKGNKESYSFMRLPEETYKGLPPVFADSLPDKFGSAVLNSWLKTQGKSINDLHALEKLSYIGIRGMGALEYFPNISLGDRTSELNISEIVQIAQDILEKKENFSSELNSVNDILQIGTSAGGARAKSIIAINENTNEIVSGDMLLNDKNFKYYIIKIDGVKDEQLGSFQGYGKIEFAYYKMAVQSGIKMMPSKLYQENGREHFLTERFDRVKGEKLHMQTLCGIAGMDYNNPFENSYEQAFSIMNRLNLGL
jgi:serine/threonine-protein kinase HipA